MKGFPQEHGWPFGSFITEIPHPHLKLQFTKTAVPDSSLILTRAALYLSYTLAPLSTGPHAAVAGDIYLHIEEGWGGGMNLRKESNDRSRASRASSYAEMLIRPDHEGPVWVIRTVLILRW